MNEKKYTLAGKPIAWKRAGLNNKTFFDTQKQQKLINGLTIRQQHGTTEQFSGPLELEITFFFKISKQKKKEKPNMTKRRHYQRPDLSNLIKYIEDMVQSIIFKDDCIIAKITAEKYYDDLERTEFTIRPLEK